MESNTYMVAGQEFELKHYGVKGMKWGRRKARPEAVDASRRGAKTTTDSPEAQATAKAARQQKAKRAMTYGTIAVTSFLAAYGAKRIADSRRSLSVGMLEKTLAYVNAINKYYS
jgi:hypothetical protein